MDATVKNRPLWGLTDARSAKSFLHRALICAALADKPTQIAFYGMGEDVQATIRCLCTLGARIQTDGDVISVYPICRTAKQKQLDCAQSGSTLRFLLPVAAALGENAAFHRSGRLPQRPLSALCEAMRAHGCKLSPPEKDPLCCTGKLQSGAYEIAGDISSQFISGLLLALPLLEQDSCIRLTSKPESVPYIKLTIEMLSQFGVRIESKADGYRVAGGQKYRSPLRLQAEGDWSNAAFFLAAGAFSERGVTVTGLGLSKQADRQILAYLRRFGADIVETPVRVTVSKKQLRGIEIDAADIPDLVPILAAVATVSEGTTRIIHAKRLRLKESDRLITTMLTLNALGADVSQTDDGLLIHGKKMLRGGTVSGCGDHRIAMTAAITAAVCQAPVTITEAEAVRKSFPDFFEELSNLHGEVATR